MIGWLIRLLICLGSVLMVFNIVSFIRYARYIKGRKFWAGRNTILNIPIALLIFFLAGYLFVGFLGNPDLVMTGILFGGSIFVCIMYFMLRNITTEIVKGEEMKAQLLAAEQATNAKTAFMASVSHEMRTPMNVILGYGEKAIKDPSLSPEIRTCLQKQQLSARHLLDLINNILELNSIETGSKTLKNEVFFFSGILDEINVLIQSLCDAKGLRYEYSMPDEAKVYVTGDRVQLKQLLLGILDNAVKYTDTPGTVRFICEYISEDEKLRTFRFRIEDTGVGIDAEFLPHIFDAFSQEDASSTTRYSGLGVSLASGRRMIELMDGSITVESEKNKGTVFTVTIPLPLSDESPASIDPETAEFSLEGCRVLIVEDRPENAEIVMDLLELEGVETDHAENGKIGLDMFSNTEPDYYDAVLMDIRMPVMDGIETTMRIRALERPDARSIPIIALSANASEGDVRKSLEAGMNAHLAKPADVDSLYSTLKKYIFQRKKGDEPV